jgi:hypothetical protein
LLLPATARPTSFVGHPPYPRRLLDPYEMAGAKPGGGAQRQGERRCCSYPVGGIRYLFSVLMRRVRNMTITGGTKRRPIRDVIFRIAALIGIIGVILYLVTFAVVSREILYTAYALLALAAVIAVGNGIVILAMKQPKA